MEFVLLDRAVHNLDLTTAWTKSEFNITNTGSKSLWCQLRDSRCDGVAGPDNLPLALFPLRPGEVANNSIAIRRGRCDEAGTGAVTVTTESNSLMVTFKLCFFDSRPTRTKKPKAVVDCVCHVTVPTGSPETYALLFDTWP
jgi:hypothetical protein